jgi:NADPH:quinone reductase-like Zn-dependent oxidoreductase
VQFLHEIGAYIYAVSRTDKYVHVRDLGVDRFINLEAERYEDVVGKVDLVLDFAGNEHTQRAYSVLKDGGRYVTALMLAEPPEEAVRRGIHSIGVATQPNVEQLEDIAQRIDAGRLKVFVNRVYPLNEAQDAINFRLTTIEPGKIILSVP